MTCPEATEQKAPVEETDAAETDAAPAQEPEPAPAPPTEEGGGTGAAPPDAEQRSPP